MDMKKLLSIVDNSGTNKKSVITEGKNMAKDMVMNHYSKPQQTAPKFKSNINEYLKIVNNEMLSSLQEQQEQKKIEVKKIVNRVLTRMDESKTVKATAPKPRNFVAKNATTSGAGAHKDKKKADKQGDVKHKAKALDLAELRTEVKDKDGKVTSWKDEGEWKKAEKNKDGKPKDPRGKVANLSDKARRETEKELTESYGSVEVGAPVKVYSNVLKKAVFGKVVKLKEGRAYIQYNNTKIVMGHPIETVQLNEDAATTAAGTKVAAATGGKLASRLIPGVGAAVGAYDAYDRAKKGDYIGAGLSGLGALTSFIPGVGTAATMGLAGAQLARDYKVKTGAFAPDEAEAGADAATQTATPAPGAMTPNPKAPAAAPAIKDPVALQKELIAVGADLGPTGADGKIGKLTKAAMANPKYAEIVKKYTTAPTQTATPATNGGSPAAAAVRAVTPAMAAVARQAAK